MRSHPVLLGITLIVIGALGFYGGISGDLAPMIGALFDPTDLVVKQGVTPKALSKAGMSRLLKTSVIKMPTIGG